MQERPLFSIIMPNYNNAKYIKEAIDSVIAQTYTNWELVIVDDASTDNSLSIIKTYLNNERINLVPNSINKGVAYAAKLAVDNSSGEIVGTLDSDDVLDKNAIMTMVNEHLAYPEYGLIFSNYYKCDKDLEITGKINLLDPLPDDISLQEILLGCKFEATISWHFRTFKKSAYDMTEGYNTTLRCYEDRDLYYKLEKVTKVKCINKCLLYYRDASTEGAFRRNSNIQYYWFLCEYKETNRRLGVNLPFADKKTISVFWANLMYARLRKSTNIRRDKLRKRFRSFFLGMGFGNLRSNKLFALLCVLNSFLYGYTQITFNKMRKFQQ